MSSVSANAVYVSYAWSADTDIVDRIERRLLALKVDFRRDIRCLAYRESILDFTLEMAAGHRVIVVVSDIYLRSSYCMRELLELYRHSGLGFRRRVYPVVLPCAKGLFDAEARLAYIGYWKERLQTLRLASDCAGASGSRATTDELDWVHDVVGHIDDLLAQLADMNSYLRDLSDTDIDILIDAIVQRRGIGVQADRAVDQRPVRERPGWAEAMTSDPYGMVATVRLRGLRSAPWSSMRFRLMKAGRFHMAADDSEPGRRLYEGPKHEVILSRDFWMAETPCTQEAYGQLTGQNPSRFIAPLRPVESVSWAEVAELIDELNSLAEGVRFALPSEAQWEFCARAGQAYADSTPRLNEQAWYRDTASSSTHVVGAKAPNPWGLYDMLGNVWEWCDDWYAPYTAHSAVDPSGPRVGERRVVRGGSWADTASRIRWTTREAHRDSFRSERIGFRLTLSV